MFRGIWCCCIFGYVLRILIWPNTFSLRDVSKCFWNDFGNIVIRIRSGFITKGIQLKTRLQKTCKHLSPNGREAKKLRRINFITNISHSLTSNNSVTIIQFFRSCIILDLLNPRKFRLTRLQIIRRDASQSTKEITFGSAQNNQETSFTFSVMRISA